MKYDIKKIAVINSAGSLAVSLILLAVSFFTKNVPSYESYVYKNGEILEYSWRRSFEIILDIACILVLLMLTASTVICIVYKIRSKEKIAKRLISSWLAAFASFIMLLFSDVLVTGLLQKNDFNPKCYEFTDGHRTIVIEEESFLLYGGGTIYQIYDDSTAVVIGMVSTDDGMRNNGNYDIKWFDDHAEITYSTFVSNESKATETVNFNREVKQ